MLTLTVQAEEKELMHVVVLSESWANKVVYDPSAFDVGKPITDISIASLNKLGYADPVIKIERFEGISGFAAHYLRELAIWDKNNGRLEDSLKQIRKAAELNPQAGYVQDTKFDILLSVADENLAKIRTDASLSFEEKKKLIEEALDLAKDAQKTALSLKDNVKIQDSKNAFMRLFFEKGKLYGNEAAERADRLHEPISKTQKAELIQQAEIAIASTRTALKYSDKQGDKQAITKNLEECENNMEKLKQIKTY